MENSCPRSQSGMRVYSDRLYHKSVYLYVLYVSFCLIEAGVTKFGTYTKFGIYT